MLTPITCLTLRPAVVVVDEAQPLFEARTTHPAAQAMLREITERGPAAGLVPLPAAPGSGA